MVCAYSCGSPACSHLCDLISLDWHGHAVCAYSCRSPMYSHLCNLASLDWHRYAVVTHFVSNICWTPKWKLSHLDRKERAKDSNFQLQANYTKWTRIVYYMLLEGLSTQLHVQGLKASFTSEKVSKVLMWHRCLTKWAAWSLDNNIQGSLPLWQGPEVEPLLLALPQWVIM